ncbi:MAG: hypothetical protein R6U35_05205 [Candidatus Humimicrobiaceae bacterium]
MVLASMIVFTVMQIKLMVRLQDFNRYHKGSDIKPTIDYSLNYKHFSLW